MGEYLLAKAANVGRVSPVDFAEGRLRGRELIQVCFFSISLIESSILGNIDIPFYDFHYFLVIIVFSPSVLD